MNQIKHIRLDKLRLPSFEAHQTPDPEADKELTDSIRELGILEPLLVRDTKDGPEIIIGTRRFRCGGRAGLAAAPCIFVKATDSEAETLKIHENIKRLPLSHIDQALTFEHLRSKFKMTEQQISILTQKSIPYISQHLVLLHSDETLVQAVQGGRLNFSVARELMHVDDPDELKRLLQYAENDGATAETAHNWVHQYKRDKHVAPDKPPGAYKPPQDIPPEEAKIVCRACECSTPITKSRVVRLCHECFRLIFTHIDEEKMIASSNQPAVPSGMPSDGHETLNPTQTTTP